MNSETLAEAIRADNGVPGHGFDLGRGYDPANPLEVKELIVPEDLVNAKPVKVQTQLRYFSRLVQTMGDTKQLEFTSDVAEAHARFGNFGGSVQGAYSATQELR